MIPGSDCWTAFDVPLRWLNERFRLLHHVREQLAAIGSSVAANGAYHPDVPGAYWLAASGGPLSTTLWIRAAEDRDMGLEYSVTGPTEQVDHDAPHWSEVLTAAYDRLRAEPVPFRHWAAVLGPCPQQGAAIELGGPWPQRLDAPITNGLIKLSPIDQWTVEDYRYPLDSTQWYAVGYWPVEVRGQVEAHEWETARDRAAWTLSRVSLLLSLACEWRWTARRSPAIGDRAELDAAIATWRQRADQQSSPSLCEQYPAPQQLQVPVWVTNALQTLDSSAQIPLSPSSSRALERALNAYDMGYADYCERRTSSAAERFVTALEALGRQGQGQSGVSARNAVAAFLANGKPPAEDHLRTAAKIVMYRRRSSTAHAGTSHGNEARLGLPMRISNDHRHGYTLRVDLLRSVCRALIIKELGGPSEHPHVILDRLHAIETSLALPGRM